MESLLTLQKRVNEAYYKSKGSAIYDDFSTFASDCDKISIANARDFHSFLETSRLEKARVLECGVGGGQFAYNFLKELEKVGDLPRIEYILCDFSEKMLKDAKAKLSDFSSVVSTQVVDFSSPTSLPPAHYIRMNELLSDLPAQVFVRKGSAISEVYYELHGADLKKQYLKSPSPPAEVPLFLSSPELEGYEIPFNFSAASTLLSLSRALEEGGYIDIFDYGFADRDSILDLPQDMWNDNVVREYGGQVTTDLNFILMAAAGDAAGFSPQISSQTDYLRASLKEDLTPLLLEDGLHYFTPKEAQEKKAELAKQGLLEEALEREFIADYGFWHLRMRK